MKGTVGGGFLLLRKVHYGQVEEFDEEQMGVDYRTLPDCPGGWQNPWRPDH